MIALLNSNSPKLLNIIVNFIEKFILVNVYITNKMSTFSLYIYIFIYVRMQADATVAPTCIDIIYILHVYLSVMCHNHLL